MCIICPIHGEFWQKPITHINKKCGCPYCNESRLEKEINDFLFENNIQFERQKRFEWLGRQSLDFYLPKYNIAIECQGRQHYKPTSFSNNMDGKENLKYTQVLDNKKKMLCEKHNVKLLYYSKEKYEDNIIIDKNNLLEEIIIKNVS